MAEETVVKETLSQATLAKGWELTQRLIEAGLNVRASLWLYNEERNSWRLMIGLPNVKKTGPRKAYEQIRAVMSKTRSTGITPVVTGSQQSPVTAFAYNSDLSLWDISVIDSKDPFLTALRKGLGTGKKVEGSRVHRNMINRVYIDDAYIYRLL